MRSERQQAAREPTGGGNDHADEHVHAGDRHNGLQARYHVKRLLLGRLVQRHGVVNLLHGILNDWRCVWTVVFRVHGFFRHNRSNVSEHATEQNRQAPSVSTTCVLSCELSHLHIVLRLAFLLRHLQLTLVEHLLRNLKSIRRTKRFHQLLGIRQAAF